jgi:fluoride exporter
LIARTLVVGIGGFLGASARYLLGGAIYRWLPATFPWSTFVINVTGCFGIGLVVALAEERMVLGPTSRLFLTVGVLGGYTTFSSFGYETMVLVRDGSFGAAAFNVLAQVALGLLAVAAGAAAARMLP